MQPFFRTTILFAATVALSSCAVDVGGTGDESDRASQVRLGVFPGVDGPIRAYYVERGDKAFVGGDMVWPARQSQLRAYGTRSPKNRWPKGEIPYVLAPDFEAKDAVLAAVSEINALRDRTGVNLVERTNQTDYIRITRHTTGEKDGCWSFVGRQGGEQELNVGEGCGHTEIVVHEFGHAIGLEHEHSRPEREQFIKFELDNLKNGKATLESDEFKAWFGLVSADEAANYSIYDTRSIMHYGPLDWDEFAVDPSKPIFTSIFGKLGPGEFDPKHFSQRDIDGIGTMYGIARDNECSNPCSDFDIEPGTCGNTGSGSYVCEGGCLEKVASCPSDASQTETVGGLACDSQNYVCTCKSGEEIQMNWNCDNIEDCADKSDETNCGSSTETDLPTEGTTEADFQCSDGKTIQASWRCDGLNDCSNDESDCGAPAEPDQTDCVANLPPAYLCDNYGDCPDGSGGALDELGCTSDENGCLDSLPQSYLCDGYSDCPDGSGGALDELDCGSAPGTCLEGLPQSYICDGYSDCPDGNGGAFDEEGCTGGSLTCVDDLPSEYFCDGIDDCPDGTGGAYDETGC